MNRFCVSVLRSTSAQASLRRTPDTGVNREGSIEKKGEETKEKEGE